MSRISINSATKGKKTFQFNPMTLSTLDFGRLQPVLCHGLVNGDNFKVHGSGLLRCTPQIFPPFGRMNLKTASFFVPNSQLISWSAGFHANDKLFKGQDAKKIPTLPSDWMNQFFMGRVYRSSDDNFLSHALIVSSNNYSKTHRRFMLRGADFNLSSLVPEPTDSIYDFVVPRAADTYSNGSDLNFIGTPVSDTRLMYFRLNPLGWKLYAIFKALGYDFVQYESHPSASTGYEAKQSNEFRVSALPLLAYLKVWNDFFCNAYQQDNNIVSDFLRNIYLDKDVENSYTTDRDLDYKFYDSSNKWIAVNAIGKMIAEVALPFESNYYSNAWNYPNDPTGVENAKINQLNTSNESIISMYGADALGESGSYEARNYSTVHSARVNSNKATFSILGHNALASIDKIVKRRNLVGSSAIKRLYAIFGVEPSEYSHEYIAKLAENSSRINFSAITNSADTKTYNGGKNLGDFAGVGMGQYDINFSYQSSTFGTLIAVVWLNIDPIKTHGMSPDVLRVKPLDFYTPEFDGKGYRPIPYAELTGGSSISAPEYSSKDVFGYVNLYDDYRYMPDVVLGGFCDYTQKHFAFQRDYSETRANLAESFDFDLKPQSEDMQYWHIDGHSDLTNPFNTSADLNDRFWFCVDWDIIAERPCLSRVDAFDLNGEGSISINQNGSGIA